MLIAFTAAGKGGLKADVDPRFGRAPRFVIVDAESGEVSAELENPATRADHGAGPQAAALVAEHGARGVVAGDFGPKAQAALEGLGLGMWKARTPATVEETLRLYREGGLEEIGHPR
jgi:predicted Fe-Mo cluster-binding NifX family protein